MGGLDLRGRRLSVLERLPRNSGTGRGERGEAMRGHSEIMKSDLRISGETEMEMEWC